MKKPIMLQPLLLNAWQVESQELELRCYWYPGLTLKGEEQVQLWQIIDGINAASAPLTYGIFAKDTTVEQRRLFLSRSIWCVLYLKQHPIGFVYQVDLGAIGGKKVIHSGLVKLVTNPGKEMIRAPYVALGLGNLLNFGPHYATNISHLPVIIDMFGELAHDLYPAFAEQDGAMRQAYKGVFELLKREYIGPVLGTDLSKVCDRTYRIRDSLVAVGPGFETSWQKVPKSTSTLCNLFVKEWLGMHEVDGQLHVKDDLVQIGQVDFRFLAGTKVQSCLNASRYLTPERTPADFAEVFKLGA